ncbi:hypothetical protein EMIT0196P_70119 [Pseudomonas chlororaphis]
MLRNCYKDQAWAPDKQKNWRIVEDYAQSIIGATEKRRERTGEAVGAGDKSIGQSGWVRRRRGSLSGMAFRGWKGARTRRMNGLRSLYFGRLYKLRQGNKKRVALKVAHFFVWFVSCTARRIFAVFESLETVRQLPSPIPSLLSRRLVHLIPQDGLFHDQRVHLGDSDELQPGLDVGLLEVEALRRRVGLWGEVEAAGVGDDRGFVVQQAAQAVFGGEAEEDVFLCDQVDEVLELVGNAVVPQGHGEYQQVGVVQVGGEGFEGVPGVLLVGGQGDALQAGVFGVHGVLVELRQLQAPQVQGADFGVRMVGLVAVDKTAGDLLRGGALFAGGALDMQQAGHDGISEEECRHCNIALSGI